ncbi:MAG: hypothetical protein GY929_09075 [Actinomycetia bacterium]|nr:hypothetical protein [Actinomycetes bacterium]
MAQGRPAGRHFGSVLEGDNAHLMVTIANLYLTGSVLDCTYGEGAWWRRWRPGDFVAHDLKTDGVDFRALPEADNSVDTVCFDPPYTPHGRPQTLQSSRFAERYGLDKPRNVVAIDELVRGGLEECHRVARRWVLFKCTDYVHGRQLRLAHQIYATMATDIGLRLHDLIVHHSGPGPGGPTGVNQIRARRHHSYLLVFSVDQRTQRLDPTEGCHPK